MSRVRDTEQEVKCTSNRKLTVQFKTIPVWNYPALGRLFFFLYILAD